MNRVRCSDSRNYRLLFLFLWPLLLGTANSAVAQDKQYARQLVDTLAAPGIFGRGYVNGGCQKAALLIAAEMNRFGLQGFSNGYFQPFTIPINTFPDTVSFSLNGKTMKPGRDFVIASYSPDFSGKFRVRTLKTIGFTKQGRVARLKRKDLSATLLLINKPAIPKENQGLVDSLVRTNFLNAAGLVVQSDKEKLMWSVSQGYRQKSFPVFEILTSALPRKPVSAACVVNARFFAEMPVSNVIGYILGAEVPDSFLVISAHYDHLGMMGSEACFPGANDNASGVAMMLDMARHFALPGNQPKYSMVFMAFAAEETGLNGAGFYVKNPLFPLNSIRFLINLDMVGTGSEGITVVNGKTFTARFAQLARINADTEYLLTVTARGESCNSDHCPFYKEGVPAVFIYSMGKEHREYHNIYDLPGKVPLTEYEDIFRLLTDFIKEF